MKDSRNKLSNALIMVMAQIILSSVTLAAKSTVNEFTIQAANYDNLIEHATNCTFAVDNALAVTWCGDGYFAIDDKADLINPSTAFKIEANLTVELKYGAPKDLRLDTYLSMVEFEGEKLTVIKRSSMEALHIELDKTEAPQSQILGGFFSPDFVVFQILNEQ